MAFDPTRLYVSLLNTGLQSKDNPLYQVIHDLIGFLATINSQVTTVVNTPASSIPGPQGLQGIPGEEGIAGEDALPISGSQGVPGPQGIQGNPGPVGILEDGLDGEFFPPMQGQPGNAGIQGIQGPPGPMGFAEDGLEGDFFAAMPGPQGNPGIQGVAGPPGPSVPSSDDGVGSDDSIITFGLPVPPNQMVPYFIGVNEIFVIPQNKQAVFAMNIEVQGILEVDGFLVEVDGISKGSWTPTDASGAGLSFVNPSGEYIRIGPLVWIGFALQYPVTADGSAAKIGSSPFTCSGFPGFMSPGFTNTSLNLTYYIRESATRVEIFANTGVAITNAQLSGFIIEAGGIFFAV